jgi:16S rRNA (cytosine967-C5)-methyltransferase
LRKKPEIRYKPEQSLVGLPDVQLKILTALSASVKPGGVLLYSTCTILKRENEDVIYEFLQKNPRFSLEDFTLPGVGRAEQGKITLLPHIHGTDGFFICKLRRNGN